MKKAKNVQKLILTLTLSLAMLVTEIPMTALAASTEVVNDGEDAVKEQTQTEVIDEEDSENKNALGNQTGENGEDEAAKEDSGNDDNSNDETVGEETKETEDDGDSEDETTDEAPEDEENNEEVTEEPVESLETSGEISLSSVSDFVINNGVLTAYNGTDEDVEIPDGVVEIGERAFKEKNIKTVEFSSTVVKVANYAFQNCSKLKSVTLNEGLKTIGSNAFNKAALGERNDDTGVITLGTLTIPSTVQSIGSGAFCECTYLGEIEFADGETQVLEIGTYASYDATFGHCPNLSKVKLPARLKVIPEYAFTGDAKLDEVIFGKAIETIDKSAFKGCALTSIELPSTVKTIGDEAFANCSSLKSVTLNEGLKTIGSNAFNKAALGDTEAFGTLTIPSTVQNIGSGAFCECTYLGVITFADGETQVLEIGTYASYDATFGHCPELTTVILPKRITKLKDYTFYNDPKLQTLYIPSTVTEIASGAISNCPKLTIYGVSGTMAETYAKQNNILFKSKDELNISLEVQSVKLTPSYIEEAGEDVIGKKIQLRAKVLPDTAQNKELIYESADETIVTVNKAGLVTIIGYGKTTITVTTVDGGKTASCSVDILKEAIDERPLISTVLFPKNKTAYSAIYTGEQICPVMTVSYQYKDDKGRTKTQKLKLNVDYTVSYSNNVNAGENTAKVTVRGIGEYKGVITKEFTITPKNIKGVALSPVGDIVFDENLNDKLDEKPSVVVMDGAYELTRGKDYEVVLSTTGSASADTQ
ncbi:MAG: leucine-rich repeat protein, partial [Lachnospiraceae bacterium]|nr:leucine-rich repeat protein [Lachnospiraceae bacterium]